MMDVMRALLHLFKNKDNENDNKKKHHKVQKDEDFFENFFIGEENIDSGITIDRKLLMQAWAKYRPESN